MSTGENIKKARINAGLTQKELGERLGITSQSIAQWETGRRGPKYESLQKLSEALGVPVYTLMGISEERERAPIPPGFEPLPKVVSVPLVGTIACGTPILAEQNIEKRIGIPEEWHADFALTCKGDSMAPRYLDGDIVCIRQQPSVENGQIAAVLIGEEATLKRFYQDGDLVTLVPINPAYTPLVYRGSELDSISIEVRVVGFCRGE